MDTVRTRRGRFARGGLPALADRKRSERPASFTPVQVAEAKALECHLPAETDKAQRMLDRYAHTFDGVPLGEGEYVVSRDEKTAVQAPCLCHPTLAPGRARGMRVNHEYNSGGALPYLAAYDVHHAKDFGRCESKTSIAPFMNLVTEVTTTEPYAGVGLTGHADGAPYDRTIATCGVTTVPYAWVEQTRPRGLILAAVCGWLYSSELARLSVGDDGTARVPLLGGGISFMIARPQLPPPLGTLPDLDTGDERPAVFAADVLDDWTTRFVAQIAAPGAQRFTLHRNGRAEHVLLDVTSGSWAALTQQDDTWTVRQGGGERLWDAAEEHVAAWRSDGAPGLERFEVTVTPQGQTITWSR